MKKLIYLISSENKTVEQIAAAAKEAWAKYQKVENNIPKKRKHTDKSP